MPEEIMNFDHFNVKDKLSEPLRLALAVAEIPYLDKPIEGDLNFHKQKFTSWANFPVFHHGDKSLSRTKAVFRYLSRKYTLSGRDENESIRIDQLVQDMGCLTTDVRKYYSEKDETRKQTYKNDIMKTKLPKYLDKFENLKEINHGDYLIGVTLTWADIFMAFYLQQFEEIMGESILEEYPNLTELKKTVFNIQEISEWMGQHKATVVNIES